MPIIARAGSLIVVECEGYRANVNRKPGGPWQVRPLVHYHDWNDPPQIKRECKGSTLPKTWTEPVVVGQAENTIRAAIRWVRRHPTANLLPP